MDINYQVEQEGVYLRVMGHVILVREKDNANARLGFMRWVEFVKVVLIIARIVIGTNTNYNKSVRIVQKMSTKINNLIVLHAILIAKIVFTILTTKRLIARIAIMVDI